MWRGVLCIFVLEKLSKIIIFIFQKYIENVKKSKNKQGYNPLEKYDETNLELAAFGEKKLLSKYDETIDGEKRKKFRIGTDGKIDTTMVDIKRQMREDMVKNSVNLNLGEIKVSSDFYTPDEMEGFKKRKRKVKKVRKTGMKLMDDLLERRDFEQNPFEKSESKDHGSRKWKRGQEAKTEEKEVKEEDFTITEDELQAQLDAAGNAIQIWGCHARCIWYLVIHDTKAHKI